MNINKKNLIITIIMIVAFIALSFNLSVSAVNANAGFSNITLTTNTNSVNSTNMIEIVDNTNTIQVTDTNTNTTVVNTSNTTPEEVPDTGIEDLPWLVIGICAISAAFAYNKIKEYKSI